jgi:hypothetical protein
MIASFDDSAGYFLPDILGKTNHSGFVTSPSGLSVYVRNVDNVEVKQSELYANYTDYSTFSFITVSCNVYAVYVNKCCSFSDNVADAKYCQCQHVNSGFCQDNTEQALKGVSFYYSLNTKIHTAAIGYHSHCSSKVYKMSQDHKNLVNISL